jgi:hypothetical protein
MGAFASCVVAFATAVLQTQVHLAIDTKTDGIL